MVFSINKLGKAVVTIHFSLRYFFAFVKDAFMQKSNAPAFN